LGPAMLGQHRRSLLEEDMNLKNPIDLPYLCNVG
jgi:hypothetical protein